MNNTETYQAPTRPASTLTKPMANRLRPVALAVCITLGALTGCTSNNSTSGSETPSGFELVVSAVAMRDGVELYTEALLPANIPEAGVPTLLLRTPYDLPTLPIGGLAPSNIQDEDDDEDDQTDAALALTRAAWQPIIDRGYAIVFQNLRGTQSSGGRNDLFAAEREDGVDTLQWIQSQNWSNGRIGAMGDSAAGFSVHLLAAENPPGLEATFAQVSCGDIWGSAILPDHGGVKLETFLPFMLSQSLEVSEEHLASLSIGEDAIESAQAQVMASLGALFSEDPAEQFQALSQQPFIDYPGVSTLLPQWRYVLDESSRGELNTLFDTRGQSNVPGMHVAMWQDIFVECTLGDFQALATGTTEQKLLVLDGSHYEIDDAASWPYLPMLDWFDTHLKDAPAPATATVQFAVQSSQSIEQRSMELVSAENWPPEHIERTMYLDAQGGLNENYNSEVFSSAIDSDPNTPRSNTGGRHLVIEAGISELNPVEQSDDQLIFTSPANELETIIAGEVRLETTIIADVADADIHARLVEVGADGKRVLIVEGMQRARFRDSALTPTDIEVGQAVPMSVSLGNIAHKLSAGSQLQLAITTSNFPAWNLNAQLGGSSVKATDYRPGTITIQSSPENPSRLVIPVLP